MTVEAQRCGQISGTSANLVLFSLARGEGLVDSWRPQKSYQSGTKLLPQEGREVCVGVNFLR